MCCNSYERKEPLVCSMAHILATAVYIYILYIYIYISAVCRSVNVLNVSTYTLMLEKSASTLIVLIVRAVFPSHYFGVH